jgi:hypothetical protein
VDIFLLFLDGICHKRFTTRALHSPRLVNEEGKYFMEPIDTDFDYVASRSRETNPRGRFNWLYILPTLGVLWIVYLTLAVIFQWPLTGQLDPVMAIMMLLFVVTVVLLFWALAPRSNRV